ncbi:Mov34/MPN/PAD-1 family protein [Clostridium gasigenes]|uniref:Mov34/MPN/PAD-1 family protein n=1 Tax=Clostridium gasigenes TaxID=94869 RepID=UPI001623D784|nr:Mov34/MPN/PAD-1 family protein [Clostridium gasigenes]
MIEFKFNNKKMQITSDVLGKLTSYIQVSGNYEAGGLLIASLVKGNYEIEINDCTTPIEEDKRSLLGYRRSDKHNKILNEKWKESNYKKLYIGEWHTHPQNIPIPSFQDKTSWKKLLSKSMTESEYLIFIIVGIESLEIWIGDKKRRKIERGASYKY